MTPKVSQYCFRQCLEVLEENEDEILKQFMAEVTLKNIEEIICTKMGKYCRSDESGDGAQRSEL